MPRLKLSCPVCAKQFDCDIAEPPMFGTIGEESDGRLLGEVCPPEGDYVIVCPHCRYTAVGETMFYEEVPNATASSVRQGALRRLSYDPRKAADRYFLAVESARLRDEPPFVLGYLHLRGSWAARADGDEEAEVAHQESALTCLESAIADDSLDPDDRAVAYYLLGELNRRLACFQTAIKYFDRLIAEYPNHGQAERAVELRAKARMGDSDPVVWTWEESLSHV